MNAEAAVDQLFVLCEQQAQVDYVGEPISQLDHMVQAAQWARREGADDELILAAFCHDIGHFCEAPTPHNSMAGLGRKGHEYVGAHWLRQLGFSPRLCGLVQRHVQAKRYQCWRHPDYLASLSAASRQTLVWQGGPMSAEQAEAFENDPWFSDSLRLRRWDEAAKVPGLPLPELQWLRALALRVYGAGAPKG